MCKIYAKSKKKFKNLAYFKKKQYFCGVIRKIGYKGTTKNPNVQIKMKNTSYSVKKYQLYLVLFLACLVCGTASAKVNHYVGGFAQIGEWSLMPSQSDYSASLGVAGGAGFLYELQAGKNYSPLRFLFNVGVGATGGMTAYSRSTDQTATMFNQLDLQKQPFDYVYEIKDRKDRYNNVAVHIPVMFGLQYKRFYALAGVKVYANIWTKAYSAANLTTYGHYDQFIGMTQNGDFRSMPMYQFFDEESVNTNIKTSLNLDLDLSLEVGARLGTITYGTGYDVPKRKMEYRIAAFMDYGLMDVHTNGSKPAVVMPERYDIDPASENYVYNSRSMVENLTMNDIMATEGFAKMVNNLVVGVKFTVLFQLPEQQKCVMCSDGYRSMTRSYGRSRRGMKYEE